MPSKIVDLQRLSPSSIFSEELHLPNERQIGFWKTENTTGHHGLKADGKLRTTACNSISLSPSASTMENQILVDSHIGKCLDIPNIYPDGQQVNLCTEKHVMGVDRSSSTDMWIHPGRDSEKISNLVTKPVSYITEGQNFNIVGHQYENGFFSSSLSDLFSRKIILSSNDALHGHSVGGSASNYEDEEPFESLEELEAQTIGNLLPDDDDLLSGVTEGFDYVAQPNSKDDVEDLDFFSSVGGLDLGDDGYSLGQVNSDLSSGHLSGSNVALAGEHPSRTLFVRNISTYVDNSELRALFEQYGDIRTLNTACKHQGFVIVSYYDLRAALKAMETLQNKPLKCRNLDIHFSSPKDNLSEKDINQGTLVVCVIDSAVSNSELRQIFGVYGEIKEIRETPQHHKFIEFYDVRVAEAVLCALNKSDVAGMGIKLETSLHGGTMRLMQSASELEQDELSAYLRQSSSNNVTTGFTGTASHRNITSCKMDCGTIVGEHTSTGTPVSRYLDNPFHHGISSSVPSSLSSLVGAEPIGNQSSVADSSHSSGHLKFDLLNTPNFHPRSVPNYHDSLVSVASCISEGNMATNISGSALERMENWQFSRVGIKGHSVGLNGSVFCASGYGCSATPAHHYTWNSSPKSQGRMWSNSASFVNGVCSPHPSPGLHSLPRAPSHMLNTLLPINNHLVGSAPSVNPSLWDRRHAYAGELSDASAFHPGSDGNMRISSNSLHPLEFVSHNIFPHAGGNCLDIPISSKGLHSPQQSCLMFPRDQMYPVMSPFDSPSEHARRRRAEGSSSKADSKKQYELDIDRIMHQEDRRTTLMIKNIPNKYTSKMLLAAIDEHHRGTYDFLYLPIDFKNKCNVGYAFINMTDPSLIIPFYKAFNGKKWEKFNSEKVASLAYARIQGKASLIAHFQNSSLMNEDKRCRPILFHTDGPNAGDQVPFPMGANVRSKANKNPETSDE